MLSSDDVAFFMVVAESKNLAAAARRLGVTGPSVTQKLNLLEEKLKVPLIDRGTRRTSLTSHGSFLINHGASIVESLEDLHNSLITNYQDTKGTLKVSCSFGFGVKYLAPIVADFHLHHPQIKIDVFLSEHPLDINEYNPDVIIHIGELIDSNFIKVTLSKNKRILVASPEYIEKASELLTPKDLARHRCIALRENNEDVTMWKFTDIQKQVQSVRITPYLSSNVGEVVKSWALGGNGIIVRSEWDVAEELRLGKLLQLLPNYTLPGADIVALVKKPEHLRSKKLNLFIEYLKRSVPSAW